MNQNGIRFVSSWKTMGSCLQNCMKMPSWTSISIKYKNRIIFSDIQVAMHASSGTDWRMCSTKMRVSTRKRHEMEETKGTAMDKGIPKMMGRASWTAVEPNIDRKQSSLDKHDPEKAEKSSPKSLLLFYYLSNWRTPSGELGTDSYIYFVLIVRRWHILYSFPVALSTFILPHKVFHLMHF